MNRTVATAVSLLIGLFLTTSSGFAQLAPGSDGRLLDANNQVGSGGINTATPRNLFNTSNLYITGNTTRGTAFQGFSPVRNQFSLFSTLPSTVLANFERDSVGLNSITGYGAIGVTNPYFNRTQTVANAGAIGAGLNQIGSSIPANNYFAPTRQSLPSNSRLYGFNTLADQYNINPTAPNATIPGTTPLADFSGYSNSLDQLRLTRETSALQSSPLFPNARDRFSLSGTPVYQNPYVNPYGESTDSLLRETAPLGRSQRSIDNPLRRPNSEEMLTASNELISPTSVAPRLFQSALTNQRRDPLTGRTLPDDSRYLAIQSGESGNMIQPSTLTRPANASMPAGATTAYGEGSIDIDTIAAGNRAARFESYTPDSIAAANSLLEQLQSKPNVTDAPGDGEMQNQMSRAQSILDRATTESLSTLASTEQTSSAQLIADAEKRVLEGNYYQAAQLYEMASRKAHNEAMPRLGHAHALFAAGEFMTAYRHLVRAIELYPAFGYLNFDLTTFIPDANLIDVRRAKLEEQLKNKEDYRLRFLLGYVEYYIGLKQFGLPNLRRAAGDAPEGSIPKRFPDMLERPASAAKPKN